MVITAARDGEALLAARIAMVLTEQGLGGRSADLRDRLHRFASERGQRADGARGLADPIARLAGGARGAANEDHAGRILAIAYPDRVAKVRQGGFSLVNGRAAALEETSPLLKVQYAVIADMAGAAGRAQVILGAPIEFADIEAMFGPFTVRISATLRMTSLEAVQPFSSPAGGRRSAWASAR